MLHDFMMQFSGFLNSIHLSYFMPTLRVKKKIYHYKKKNQKKKPNFPDFKINQLFSELFDVDDS